MLFQNNEKRDLQRIPYARAGCYFYINEDYFRRQLKLIFIYAEEMMQHGDVAFWLDILKEGRNIRYNYFGDEGSLRLVTADQDVELALTDQNQIRFRGNRGAILRIRLSSMNEEAPAEALKSAVRQGNGDLEIFFGYYGYMRFRVLRGSMKVDCQWDESRECFTCCNIIYQPDEAGTFEGVLHDYREAYNPVQTYPAFEDVVRDNRESFRVFAENYCAVPEKYRQLGEECIYVIWSHYMKPDAFVRSPMIMFQYICLAASFAWQQSFNGMAMLGNPRFGYELITNLFQYQEPSSGLLPANVNSGYINYDGAQPPLQGIAINFLAGLSGEESIPEVLAREILPKFERWIGYWTTYRTAGRGDDMIQINNPNESGWDDATMFTGIFPAADADMQALLAECMFACSTLARRIGAKEKELQWQNRGNKLVRTILDEFWDGERFVTKIDGEDHVSQSFAAYLPIILGDRLPNAVVDQCVKSLFGDDAYMTPIGLCSESMKSSLCTWGGAHFVSGRVVAPVQMLISIGLWLAGRKKEAKTIAKAWCDNVAENGVRLGFKPYEINPFTGIPAPAILEPQPSDSWSWASWSACCTMTMLETILAEPEGG